MIVLDANVLIAWLDGNDNHHDRAQALLEREVGERFGINPLTLAEVLVAPVRENRVEDIRKALADLELAELAFPVDAAFKLADLRARTNLTMPDCCVLLAAADAGARLASFDDRVVAAAATRNVVTVRQ